MVFAKQVVFFFLLIALSGFSKSNAAVYKVGDSAGWTNVGHVDYKTWASSKNFHVGDIIVFEYNKQFHNVVRVTHKNFNACNSAGAYGSFISGNDSFVIKHTGHFYFICSVPGHCESGQKVDIRVPGKTAGTPSPSPSPSPSASPIATPPATSPSPPPSVSHPPKTPAPSTSTQPPPPPAGTPPPVWAPSSTPPSYQPTANPPVYYDAPAPSPTSGSSFIYSSKGLIVFSVLFGFIW